jgi:hypothetical protein
MNFAVRDNKRQDTKRINAMLDQEIRYWSNSLSCKPEKLRQAIATVGPLIKDIKKWLAENK